MKVIKEKSSYENITKDYAPQKPTKTIVQQMEEEWPEMTKEFKRLQKYYLALCHVVYVRNI